MCNFFVSLLSHQLQVTRWTFPGRCESLSRLQGCPGIKMRSPRHQEISWSSSLTNGRRHHQCYLTPASSALLKTSFSENLFHKKSFSCRQQQHSHLGNVNFSIVFILLPLRTKSGTQHSWPVFRDFFGSMPPNRLPLLEIRSLWNVPADPTLWKFSSSDLESWRCPSLERLQQQGKQTSSPTPLFLPHPSLTLTNNHLGASLRSSRRGGGSCCRCLLGFPWGSGVCVFL